jgi:hypothetical protein
MEFFDNNITYLCVGIIYSILTFILGYNVAKKKFQVEHETPKVGTNKQTKEVCDCVYKNECIGVGDSTCMTNSCADYIKQTG